MGFLIVHCCLSFSGWDVPRAGKILPKVGPERPGSFFPLPHFPSPRRSKISDKSCAKVSRPHGPLQGLGAEGLEAARGTRADGYGSLRSGDTEGTGRGAPREAERLLSHHGKGTCVQRDLVTPQPVFPVPGTAAPGGRPLLCRPDPAADQNLPTKGYHEALLLCPG